jgi:hypothetical protein
MKKLLAVLLLSGCSVNTYHHDRPCLDPSNYPLVFFEETKRECYQQTRRGWCHNGFTLVGIIPEWPGVQNYTLDICCEKTEDPEPEGSIDDPAWSPEITKIVHERREKEKVGEK